MSELTKSEYSLAAENAALKARLEQRKSVLDAIRAALDSLAKALAMLEEPGADPRCCCREHLRVGRCLDCPVHGLEPTCYGGKVTTITRAIAAVFALLLLAGVASAQTPTPTPGPCATTCTWTCGDDNWSNVACWSCGHTPLATDNCTGPNGVTTTQDIGAGATCCDLTGTDWSLVLDNPLSVSGSVDLSYPTGAMTGTSELRFVSTHTGNTISVAGGPSGGRITPDIIFNGGGGVWTIANGKQIATQNTVRLIFGSLTLSGTLGGFDIIVQTATATDFSLNVASTAVVNFTPSFDAGAWVTEGGAGLQLTVDPASIWLGAQWKTRGVDGLTYGIWQMEQLFRPGLLQGSNTFAALSTHVAPWNLTVDAGSTNTFGPVTDNAPGALVSSTPGVPYTLVVPSDTTVHGWDISDCTCSSGTNCTDLCGTDSGGNSGWDFVACTPTPTITPTPLPCAGYDTKWTDGGDGSTWTDAANWSAGVPDNTKSCCFSNTFPVTTAPSAVDCSALACVDGAFPQLDGSPQFPAVIIYGNIGTGAVCYFTGSPTLGSVAISADGSLYNEGSATVTSLTSNGIAGHHAGLTTTNTNPCGITGTITTSTQIHTDYLDVQCMACAGVTPCYAGSHGTVDAYSLANNWLAEDAPATPTPTVTDTPTSSGPTPTPTQTGPTRTPTRTPRFGCCVFCCGASDCTFTGCDISDAPVCTVADICPTPIGRAVWHGSPETCGDGCGGDWPTPSRTATHTRTPTRTPTITQTSTPTRTPTCNPTLLATISVSCKASGYGNTIVGPCSRGADFVLPPNPPVAFYQLQIDSMTKHGGFEPQAAPKPVEALQLLLDIIGPPRPSSGGGPVRSQIGFEFSPVVLGVAHRESDALSLNRQWIEAAMAGTAPSPPYKEQDRIQMTVGSKRQGVIEVGGTLSAMGCQ